jgi:hypothetical protein
MALNASVNYVYGEVYGTNTYGCFPYTYVSGPCICNTTATVYTHNTCCCPTNRYVNDTILGLQCCSAAVPDPNLYQWGFPSNASIVPQVGACCNATYTTYDPSTNVKYCCGRPGNTYTESNRCCPSANVLQLSTGALQCCATAVQADWTYSLQANTTNTYMCCSPSSTSYATPFAINTTYCCSPAVNVNYTQGN